MICAAHLRALCGLAPLAPKTQAPHPITRASPHVADTSAAAYKT